MEFSKELIEVFDYLGEKIGIVVDWTNDNVMTYLQDLLGRYVNYEIATSIVWMIAGLLLLIISFICYKRYGKAYQRYTQDDDYDECGWMIIIGVVSLLLGVLVIGTQVFDIIKCVYLPELKIYEYITYLAEKG